MSDGRSGLGGEVALRAFEPRADLPLLERWLGSPHVARWWGAPDPRALAGRAADSHAVIALDGRPIGYLCWQRPSAEELATAGLADLPDDLVDLDILIGERELLGRGVGPRALALALARLRDEGVRYVGVGTSLENRAAIRAFEKTGFRVFRDCEDPESGPFRYLVTEILPSSNDAPSGSCTTSFDPPLRHAPRPVAFLERFDRDGWRLKLYGIAGQGERVTPGLLERAPEIAGRALPDPALTPTRYGVGFVVVHEAPAFDTVVVDWWERVNELRHRVFRAPPGQPEMFVEITASGESVCVWELRVQAFEREAWLRHVLENPEGPDLGAYLSDALNEVC